MTVAIESPGDAVAIAGDVEFSKVRAWRFEELVRAGYDVASASKIAERTDVDLHRARQLVARGCSPEIAVRILL